MSRKTSTGKWQGIVRIKGHKTRTKVFPKKAMADRWERITEEEILNGTLIPKASKILISDLISWYIREYTHRKRAAKSERSHLQIVSDKLGGLLAATLTPEEIINYVDKRLETVSSDSVRKELSKLSVVLSTAITLGKIELQANPVHIAKDILKVTKTLSKGVRRDRRITSKEIEIFEQSRIGPIVMFAIETAMRRGEIANIKKEHISWEDKTLYIPETKTDRVRTIPLSPRALLVLKNLDVKEKSNSYDNIWGMRPGYISDAFAEIRDANGIKDLRFHDLRHEGTTRLFERGFPIEKVAMITGHEDWSSLKRYTHLSAKDVAKELENEPPKLRVVK